MIYMRNKYIITTTILIVITIVMTITISMQTVYKIMENETENTATILSENIYNDINTELQSLLSASRTFSNTHYFETLAKREEQYTDEQIEEALKECFGKYTRELNYKTCFFVFDKSKKYYTQLGFNKVVDPDADEHDTWYPIFVDSNVDYAFNIDADQTNHDDWTVFINCRVEDNAGKLLGVCGFGMDMKNMQSMLRRMEDDYKIKINLVDQNGLVQIDIDDINIENRILNDINYEDISDTFNYYKSEKGYVVTKYMKNLGWYLVIQKDNSSTAELFVTLVSKNLIAILIMFILTLLLTTTILNRNSKQLLNQTEYAQHASEAKSRFLATMSHEIRTPLNAIIGLSTMILRESTEPAIKGYASDVENSSQTLLTLVNDILDLSKIESDKMDLYPVEYDFSNLLNDVIIMVSTKAESKHLIVNLDIDEHLPSKLYGDDIRIRQILVNLMNNAIKYTEKGSITLKVTGEQTEDKILLHVEVTDTGIGIKEEDMDKLFSVFERIEEERNRNIEGTGLGMNITLQLLALMDSKLQVESVYGEGSNFHFDLLQGVCSTTEIGDMKKQISEHIENYQYAAKFVAPAAKILVVDDNHTNHKVFRSLLKETHLQIDEADCGEVALEMIQATTYQVIFLDHMMPGMDGIEVLQKIKEDKNHVNQATPVIALTANAINGARDQYLQAGFVDYISKPLNFTKLEQLLYNLLKDKWILSQEELEKFESLNASNRQSNLEAPVLNIDNLPEIDGVDWEYAILKLKDSATLLDVLKDFSIMANGDLLDLQKKWEVLLHTEDSEERSEAFRQYRVKVHAMKSTTAMFGAMQVSAFAKMLEYAAKNEDFTRILACTEIFEEEWQELAKRITEEFDFSVAVDDSNKMPIEYEVLVKKLNVLAVAMEELDVDVADEIMEQLMEYRYDDTEQEKINKLIVAVRGLDSDTVQEIIDNWS